MGGEKLGRKKVPFQKKGCIKGNPEDMEKAKKLVPICHAGRRKEEKGGSSDGNSKNKTLCNTMQAGTAG